jgi:hypothetical protein
MFINRGFPGEGKEDSILSAVAATDPPRKRITRTIRLNSKKRALKRGPDFQRMITALFFAFVRK